MDDYTDYTDDREIEGLISPEAWADYCEAYDEAREEGWE